MQIGVLALQGGYHAHAQMLARCGHQARFVKTASALNEVNALIIPGGESAVLLKLIEIQQLHSALKTFFALKKPVFGTCAGMILMAKTVTNPSQTALGWVDIEVKRNAYGRQSNSTITTTTHFSLNSQNPMPLELVFIRAPQVTRINHSTVETLATYQNMPVLLRQDHALVASFHPELSDDQRIHQYFIDLACHRT